MIIIIQRLVNVQGESKKALTRVLTAMFHFRRTRQYISHHEFHSHRGAVITLIFEFLIGHNGIASSVIS